MNHNKNVIFHEDAYRIFDTLIDNQRKCGPLGWVQVFMNDKNLKERKPDFEGSNLVTAKGREFVAQRIFNRFQTSGVARTDWTGYTISHFGMGSGGATVDNDIVTLTGPFICDTGLYTPIDLGTNSYLEETGGTPTDNVIKPIATNGSVLLESDIYTNSVDTSITCEYHTKVMCTCQIISGEPSSLAAEASVQVSEAGLYFTNGVDANLFAHICFPPKYKEKESNLTLIWYILC